MVLRSRAGFLLVIPAKALHFVIPAKAGTQFLSLPWLFFFGLQR